MLLSPLFLLTWILFLALRTFLIALGWIVVPAAVACKAYHMRRSKIYPERLLRAFKWKAVWLWGNEEEGVGYYGNFKSVAMKIIYSECWRNPVNNLRYIPFFSLKIDPKKVRFIGNLGKDADIRRYDLDKEDFISLTWHGIYSNIRWQGKIFNQRYRIWLGWKIYPEDKLGIPADSHRAASVGFATQFRRI